MQRALDQAAAGARQRDVINRFALPLFLFHTTGMAIARFVTWRFFGDDLDDGRPTVRGGSPGRSPYSCRWSAPSR